ncbi:MAG: serine hydrolase [Bdellovibrionales bacterium]|nr:serine hydrolase [Bdellovibrionales bacterium]
MQNAEVFSQFTTSSFLDEIDSTMLMGIDENVFPGACLLVGQNGKVIYNKAFGFLSNEANSSRTKVTTGTVYDLAGITGSLVTTTLIMLLVEKGRLKLEDKVSRYLQSFSVHGKSPITIKHLLNQTSGLVAWHPFYEEILKADTGARKGIIANRVSKEFVINSINRMVLKQKPGKKEEYSDLNFMILGFIIEILTGMSIERAAQKMIFNPLGMRDTGFIDLSMLKRRGVLPIQDIIAPTEKCSWRNKVIHGEVHDDNTWAMGGIAGHSGLFSNASDIHKILSELLRAYAGNSTFLRAATVRRFFEKSSNGETCWSLGWENPSEWNAMNQAAFSDCVVGRSGFTGCSVWLEPTRGLDFILLSNRVNPTRANKKIKDFIPQIVNTVLRLVD